MKRILILLALMLPVLAFAAVETTTITGKVIMPNGVVATAGTVTATLSASGSTLDPATGQNWNVGGRYLGTIAADGTVTGLVLVPNDAITPAGTYYTVVISVTAPTRDARTMLWNVTTTPDPVSIGAINRLDEARGLYNSIADAADVTLTTLVDEQCLKVDVPGGVWTNKACDPFSPIFSGSATLDFLSIPLSTCADLSIPVAGSIDGAPCSVGPIGGSVAPGSMFLCAVSVAGTVVVRHCCVGAANCNPAIGVFRATVFP